MNVSRYMQVVKWEQESFEQGDIDSATAWICVLGRAYPRYHPHGGGNYGSVGGGVMAGFPGRDFLKYTIRMHTQLTLRA